MAARKVTVPDLLATKGQRKVVNASVMDASMARIIDASQIDMAGAGASMAAMIIRGHTNPIPATLDQVLVYLRPIARTLRRALLATTLPYGTYQQSNEEALRTAIALIQAGADSVKIEGVGRMLDRIHAISGAGIPCMGHVGMTPQQIHLTGRYRSVGRTAVEAVRVYREARQLQEAGAWMIELECVPWRVAERITRDLRVLTMGTGSGCGCDGQGLMAHDIWSLRTPVKPRLAKRYDDLHTLGVEAIQKLRQAWQSGAMATEPDAATMPDDEYQRFLDAVN